LKVRPFNMLLKGPPALAGAANINMLWAHLMVDELCRLGSSTFCIAPGMARHLEKHPHSVHFGMVLSG
jgi:isochorismate synthase/2-succinyl-5-enolpyruvyl-6-hydroxy-3-cyclohexene-1-carboxylate synthase/2-succinyl-6-hydroxy-2,4-cyclohexadiene-1-carboxylate synthase/O-succinylbenzoate synthase